VSSDRKLFSLKPILSTIDFVSHSKEESLIEIDMEIETVAHPMRGGMAYNSTNPCVDRMHLLERSIYQV